mmetsp:Transcript_98713/g.228778  ORF Transcript_98713/g.228778 Transcript_98713/m.228778 type:complete len:559 (-) Transcript_98713:128-1804(-)
MRPLRPVILVVQVALGAAAGAPCRATADALPTVGLLTCQLNLHAALHGHFRLPHVRTVAPQLSACKLCELLEVAERPVGIGREGRQGGAKNTGQRLVHEVVARCLELLGESVHGHPGTRVKRACEKHVLHLVLCMPQATAKVALELLAILVHESLFEVLPLLVKFHEKVLRGIDGIHHHVAPVPFCEGSLYGQLARISRVGENARDVGDNFLCHAPDRVSEVLVERIHKRLRPYLCTMDLALPAVHACLDLPKFLLLLPKNLTDPGLKVLLLDLESILHGGLGNLEEHPVGKGGPKAMQELPQLVAHLHLRVESVQDLEGRRIGHLALLVHLQSHDVNELNPEVVDLRPQVSSHLWQQRRHEGVAHTLFGMQERGADVRVAADLMDAEGLDTVEYVRLAKLRLQVRERCVEVPHHLLNHTLEVRSHLLQRFCHDLSPLLLEDALNILHVHARALLQQQVVDAHRYLFEEVIHGALLERQVNSAAPEAINGSILSPHGPCEGEPLVALHLLVGELGVVRPDKDVKLVVHLLQHGVSQRFQLTSEPVVDGVDVTGGARPQ